jgi:ribosome biogenesis SPOUT family RNA methylase Rps3
MHRKNKRAKTEENEDSEDVEKEDICFICGEVLKGDEIKRHRTQHPKTVGVLLSFFALFFDKN